MAITLTNTGERVDLLLKRGSPFTRVYVLKRQGVVIDVTNYVFGAQVRTLSGALAATFACSVVNGPQGIFQFSLPAVAIGTLAIGTTYAWSLEFTTGGATYEIFRGSVDVVDDITQP